MRENRLSTKEARGNAFAVLVLQYTGLRYIVKRQTAYFPLISFLHQAIAEMTSWALAACSARTDNSIVTPCPLAYVILLLASTLPPPPHTRPDKFKVCTDAEVGDSVPPRGSIFRISTRESHAAVCEIMSLGQAVQHNFAYLLDSPKR